MKALKDAERLIATKRVRNCKHRGAVKKVASGKSEVKKGGGFTITHEEAGEHVSWESM